MIQADGTCTTQARSTCTTHAGGTRMIQAGGTCTTQARSTRIIIDRGSLHDRFETARKDTILSASSVPHKRNSMDHISLRAGPGRTWHAVVL
jgi:hypothetical protein